MTIDDDRRPRRFSEGMEQLPSLAASARMGSFGDGMATAAVTRMGAFADGQSLRPDAPAARSVGSFGDVEPPAPTARSRRRIGLTPRPPRAQPA